MDYRRSEDDVGMETFRQFYDLVIHFFIVYNQYQLIQLYHYFN